MRGGGCTSSKSTTILDISIVKLRSSSYCHTCGRARSPKHTMAGEHASCLPNDTHRRMSGADRGVVARWYCEQLVNIDRLRAHQVIQILSQARASLREIPNSKNTPHLLSGERAHALGYIGCRPVIPVRAQSATSATWCLGVKESHAHILVTRSRANAPLRGNHIAHVIAHRMRTNQGTIPWHSAGSIPIYCA